MLSKTNHQRLTTALIFPKIVYRIVCLLLHLQLRRQLDYQPSVDPLGFRPKTGVDHAFVVSKKLFAKFWNGNAGFGLLGWTCEGALAKLKMEPFFARIMIPIQHGEMAKWNTNIWAANTVAIWILELRWMELMYRTQCAWSNLWYRWTIWPCAWHRLPNGANRVYRWPLLSTHVSLRLK